MSTRFALHLQAPDGKWFESISDGSRRFVEGYAQAYRERTPRLPSRVVKEAPEGPSILLSEWDGGDGLPMLLIGFGYNWQRYESAIRDALNHMAADADYSERRHDHPDAAAGAQRARAALKILEGA